MFPQTEIGADRGAVRAHAQRVDELGFFTYLLAYDHVGEYHRLRVGATGLFMWLKAISSP